MMGDIFNKYSLSSYIGEYSKNLRNEIDKLEIVYDTNIVEIVDRLLEKYTIEPIDIKEPTPSPPKEIAKKFRDNWGDEYEVKVFSISIKIPFEGDKDLFFCSPSHSTIVFLDTKVVIHHDYISFSIELNDLDVRSYESALSQINSSLSCNLPNIAKEIKPWNDSLEQNIKNLLQERRSVVSAKFDFMKQIGLEINPKSNDIIPPPVAKKIVPKPVTDTTRNIEKNKVPILQENVYLDIIETLYNVGRSIERKPSLYLSKHEEDLRDVFLLFLETRYEATSGVGEAFNKKGKTDILLKYANDGSNLFVAECKIWKGPKKLFEGIDQLLGYLTHRDSKTALIIFVDQKDFIAVVTTLKDEIKNHVNFKRFIKENYDSSISYEFKLPQDDQKIIKVEVLLFHFPK